MRNLHQCVEPFLAFRKAREPALADAEDGIAPFVPRPRLDDGANARRHRDGVGPMVLDTRAWEMPRAASTAFFYSVTILKTRGLSNRSEKGIHSTHAEGARETTANGRLGSCPGIRAGSISRAKSFLHVAPFADADDAREYGARSVGENNHKIDPNETVHAPKKESGGESAQGFE
jgi:hypothetical protein